MTENQNPPQQQAKPAPQSTEDRLAHLSEQIAQFKKDWEDLRAAKTSAQTVLAEIKEAQETVKADAAAVSEAKTAFATLETEAQQQAEKLDSKVLALQEKIQEAEEEKGRLAVVLTELQQIKSDAEQAKNSVNVDVQATKKSKADFESLRNETQSLHTDLQTRQTNAQEKIDEIHDLHGQVKGLYDELLQDTRDPKTNKVTAECVKTQMDKFFDKAQEDLAAMNTQRESAKAEFASLKNTLEKEIRALLPEAGAAGLSGAYVQAKSRYGAIPFEGEKKGREYWWHLGKSYAASVCYYVLFIAPLLAMTWLFVDLFKDFKDLQGKSADEMIVVLRALISLPLLVISWFGWSSIKMSRRLYEEYNHKQRVMELYHSFKKEVDEHGGPEHKKALLGIMLKAVDDKPSLTAQQPGKSGEEGWPLSLEKLLPFVKKQ